MSKALSEKQHLRRKRAVALVSFAVVVCVLLFLTYFLIVRFSRIARSGEEFRDFIQSYGAFGVFVALGIQVLQVFIAIIPGEFVEIGMGYAYGWLEATILSLGGVAIGSAFIFILVKKFGIRFVELFVSTDKINQLKFIRSEEKLKRFTFLLYFLPGTPKDLITYFIGLTRMSLKDFLGITIFARIPSVASSTIGGNLIGEKHYLEAVILFLATAAVSLLGMYVYKRVIKKLIQKHKENGRFSKHFKKNKRNK